MTRHPGTCEVEQWPARREAFRDAIRKARGLVHGRTCEFCHTTFGEPSEEQFYPCWTRRCEEHERLIAEGKIPAPKLISPSGRPVDEMPHHKVTLVLKQRLQFGPIKSSPCIRLVVLLSFRA